MDQCKKKIAIINHWMVNNYGALFLAYALERKILEMGYDVETISWLPDEVRKPWKLSMLRKIGPIQYLMRLGYFLVFIIPRQNSFSCFRSQIHKSKQQYNDRSLYEIRECYDTFVIGGDQLWNCKKNYYNENNFLPFICESKRKVVYAASLSLNYLPKEVESTFRHLAGDFGYITAREERGREIIEQTTGRKAYRVSDPAFLLSEDEWLKLSRPVKGIKNKFVFVYQVQSDVLLIRFAESIAKKHNLDIVYCPFPLKKQIACKRYPFLSPEQWLWCVKNAEYVVTDAFHGTVFSIIFNRDFFVEISEYGKDTGSRITNILDIYSLQDRLISEENWRKKLEIGKICFEPVNQIINSEKLEAERHLINMLGMVMKTDSTETVRGGGGK